MSLSMLSSHTGLETIVEQIYHLESYKHNITWIGMGKEKNFGHFKQKSGVLKILCI